MVKSTIHYPDMCIQYRLTLSCSFFLFQDLSYNSLTELPLSIGYLQRLAKLNASENQIKELPAEIGDCFGKLL